MPFEIKFGHHFKRYNSTSQPDTSGWYHTEAVWKNSQDIDNPTWHITGIYGIRFARLEHMHTCPSTMLIIG